MCGIGGFSSSRAAYTQESGKWPRILESMNRAQKRRGPDEEGIFLEKKCGLAHVRLSIIDLERGTQPMTRRAGEKSCTIAYNGEIYNMKTLRKELERKGVLFTTNSDTEVILQGYLTEGEEFIEKLNGIFAIALWDQKEESAVLCGDGVGVRPLLYSIQGATVGFAPEMKGLFQYPGVEAVADRESLCEIFALGPAKSYGKGVFRNILEVEGGSRLLWKEGRLKERKYWQLQSLPHEDSFEETAEKTSWLVEDAVKLQMLSDIPICTFLSGGIDSSLVTAICARELKKQGKVLHTFSFDFQGNEKYFKANAFQPSQDRPWVEKMVEFSGTSHHFLTCGNQEMIDCLYKAVDARDLPCMADVESSMLYFCSLVAEHNKVTLTGGCAEEIFRGYPWFHKQEAFDTHAFPWSPDMKVRQTLLSEELIHVLPMEDYARAAYEKTIGETPVLPGEGPQEKRRREISYLNLKWFMATLLDRMDRTAMYSGLEARVPFADHRIIEYVWNVPWSMKCRDGVVKALLRRSGEGKLPKEVLWRRKSPYPKTYHPDYEAMLGERLLDVLADSAAPVRQLVDREKAEKFVKSPSDYGKPWYGQLMAGPQMLAYMLQVNYWLEKYQVRILL